MDLEQSQENDLLLNDTDLLSGSAYQTPSKVEEEEQIPVSFQVSPSFQYSQQKTRDFNAQAVYQEQHPTQTPPRIKEVHDQSFSLGDQSINLEAKFGKIFANLQKIEFQLENQSLNDTVSQIRLNLNEIKDTVNNPAFLEEIALESQNCSIQQPITKHIRTRSEASFLNLNQPKEKNSNFDKIDNEQPKKCQCQKLMEIFELDINNELGNSKAKFDKSLEVISKYYELRERYLIKFEEFENNIERQSNQIEQLELQLSQKQNIINNLAQQFEVQPNDDIVNNVSIYFDQIIEEKKNLEKNFDTLLQENSEQQQKYLEQETQLKKDLHQQQQFVGEKQLKINELLEGEKKLMALIEEQKQNAIQIEEMQQQQVQFKKLLEDNENQKQELEKQSKVIGNLNQKIIEIKQAHDQLVYENEGQKQNYELLQAQITQKERKFQESLQIQNLLNSQNQQPIKDYLRIALTLFQQQQNAIYVMTRFFQQLISVFSKTINIQELLKTLNNSLNQDQQQLKQMIEVSNPEGKKIVQVFDKVIQNINGVQRILCSEYKNMIDEMNRSNEEFFKSL